jgi:hypothetical protein
MRVDHRRGNVRLPEKFLRGAEVIARLKQMSGERVVQCVMLRRLGDIGAQNGALDCALERLIEQVMSSNNATFRVSR